MRDGSGESECDSRRGSRVRGTVEERTKDKGREVFKGIGVREGVEVGEEAWEVVAGKSKRSRLGVASELVVVIARTIRKVLWTTKQRLNVVVVHVDFKRMEK